MMNTATQSKTSDIHELNLAYLFCLREMARRDPSETALRFGIDIQLAQTLAESSVEKIRSIADPALLQFKLRASNQLKAMLRNDGGVAPLLNVASLISEVAGNE